MCGASLFLPCMIIVGVCVCTDMCVHGASSHACVCLVSDFSVANPSVGLRSPNGDVFSADITSPGRPLIRSQSFHNAPGKWPLCPSLWSLREEASHCLLFQHTEKLLQSSGKE